MSAPTITAPTSRRAAQHWLETSDKSIDRIAEAVGMRTAATLSIIFGKVPDVTSRISQPVHDDFSITSTLYRPHKIFTARAARTASTVSETIDWTIIRTLPHRASTGVSVGEKAVLALNARNR